MSQKTRVFVYGSLKRGRGNHVVMEEARGKFLGYTILEGEYIMYDLGYYPGVVPAPGQGRRAILGEVYEVDEDGLFALDCLEGHPSYYKREKIETPYKKAWCYFLPESYHDEGYEPVTGGIWQPNDEEFEYAASNLL